MGNETWYDVFLELISKKYPKKTLLTQAIMEMLPLEREAVYRRLRRDVVFTAHEIVKIASDWNISLDELVGVDSKKVAFQMQQMDYLNPSEEEMNFLKRIIQSFVYFENFPDTEFMDVCNKLPRQLTSGFENLNRFLLFKWKYQYNDVEKEALPYSQVIPSEKMQQLTADYYQKVKLVPNASFIWDRLIFEYLINDIRYFFYIYLITKNEKDLIKKDLHDFLDYMEEVANKGCYPETQKKVNLYISQLNVDTNYSYVFTPEGNICFIHVFDKFEIYSYNKEMIEKFITWMQLRKRSSIQISEVDAKSRIEFFAKQRQLVDSL